MASTVPEFRQVLGSRLYVLLRGPGDVGWCAYLLVGVVPYPPTISIDESFNTYSGHYLFALGAPPLTTIDEVDAFIQGVLTYLNNCLNTSPGPFNGLACVWLTDPANPTSGPCPASGNAFSFGATLSGVALQSNLNVPLGVQLTLAVPSGTVIRGTSTGLALSGSLQFVTTTGNFGPTINPNTARIPFLGPYSGCFILAGQIDTSATLSYFSSGFQFAYNSNGSAVAQVFPILSDASPGMVVNYGGSVDPLDPLNESTSTVDIVAGRLRTLFALAAGDTPPSLSSYFVTSAGRPIGLVPQGGTDDGQPVPYAAAFVFERQQPPVSSGKLGNIYLSFAGDFALAVADPTPSANDPPLDLLCGLFGLETFSFRPYLPGAGYDRIRFVPRKPAYAPTFPFTPTSLSNPTNGAISSRLDTTYRTSWVTIVADDTAKPPVYVAQPESSPLYAPTGSAASAGVTILSPYAPGGALPQAHGFCVPLVPYAGLGTPGSGGGFPTDVLAGFESQILVPTRKAAIGSALVPQIRALKAVRRRARAAVATKTATTPQGLLAEVAATVAVADYVKVTLARSDAPAGRAPEMAFLDLDAALQNVFQTNQLFLVAVNPAHLGQPQGTARRSGPTAGSGAFENSVTIAGWTMTADVGNGARVTDYRNVLIFKFCDGALVDRVTNPNMWTDTADFSIAPDPGDPTTALVGLSQWLQSFMQDAISEAGERGNPLYKNFVRIVTDPLWNGILVLRADVDPSGFPDQIKGLIAGIDFAQFEAHHFGITVSRIAVHGSDVVIDGPSSMFALIDYQLPLYKQSVASGGKPDTPIPLPVSGPYGFAVLQLQALFQNSGLSDFRSRIQLTVNEVFGSAITQTFATGSLTASNAVVLKGSYVRQGSTSVYVFQQDAPTVFLVDSNALNAVAFERVQFNTLTTGPDDATLRSRFLIWGAFDFAAMKTLKGDPFDVLSFGTAPGTPPSKQGRGLMFSGLQIELTSLSTTPSAVTFGFDATNLAFDLANSTSRADGLFTTFALQVDDFIAAPGDKRSPDYGYLSVGMGVPLKPLSGPWYGVVYKVTMGTPGGLVAQLGFESRMLLAWAPTTQADDTSYAVFAGLQLPGAAPGAKLLSLQGILKVSIDSIQLLRDPVASGGTPAFNLRLSNIGLKFLGIAKLPPGASINFFLFGAPGGTGSLGWYAAYVKDPSAAPALVEWAEEGQ